MRLAGRVAVVTGGARHIGAAYCRRLAAEGASVVIADILDGAAVAAEITAKGGKAMALNIDVSKEEDTNRMTAETVKAFGRIDILINNAAILSTSSAIRFTKSAPMSGIVSRPSTSKGRFFAPKRFSRR